MKVTNRNFYSAEQTGHAYPAINYGFSPESVDDCERRKNKNKESKYYEQVTFIRIVTKGVSKMLDKSKIGKIIY